MWPEEFNAHKTLAKLLERRRDSILEGGPIDWGAAEALAFGSLLLEGKAVRLSGQDSRRGTFGHRHAVLHDKNDGHTFVPLNFMRELGHPGIGGEEPGDIAEDGRTRQGRLCVYDSPLSEAAVLAFEYGYSLADPRMLVIWEAQFGDFANGAQVIIDQYIASAELKWQRWSGLTLLLPHGYEGMGPEHSSARLERFLQLCADNNMQVVYPTTPAQGFHMFRRQLSRNFRKPLIVMSPKSLLRLPEATSMVSELTDGAFQEIIDDPAFTAGDLDAGKVRRIVLCSGKVYYDLARRREENGREDVALVRIEQLYPLHAERLEEIVGAYPNKAEKVWVQEEPRNMGAYLFMNEQVQTLMGWNPLPYIGREPSATPATGSKKQHAREQEALLTDAVGPAPAGDDATETKEKEKVGAR
jgi:2-oxoglutarate dehydrogenase E1 component